VTTFEVFDERARMCVVLAREQLRRPGHDELGAIHLRLGVARVDGERLGVEVEALRAAIVAINGIGTPSDDPVIDERLLRETFGPADTAL
jgi:hypothetical protein